ncbi:hypothetical protein LCGC14_2612160 [marine sediment metagenome]|uniref:Uncharacterized protein n=1 Tax=marine sediment metagenome TaxID=412755 RepID=A0A0F9CY81_9ZZZZ
MHRLSPSHIIMFAFLLLVLFMIARKTTEDSQLLPTVETMSDQEFAERVGIMTDKVEALEAFLDEIEPRKQKLVPGESIGMDMSECEDGDVIVFRCSGQTPVLTCVKPEMWVDTFVDCNAEIIDEPIEDAGVSVTEIDGQNRDFDEYELGIEQTSNSDPRMRQ